MPESTESSTRLSGPARFGYGAALPVLVLFVCQALLILSLDGSGGRDGIGLALPAILVFVEFLWLHGVVFRGIINAAFIAPFTWIWVFALLFFSPLVVTIAGRKKPDSTAA